MKHSLLFTAFLCVTGVLTPVRAQTPTPSEAPPLASITLPPELDRVLRDYERAWRSGDAARRGGAVRRGRVRAPVGAQPDPRPRRDREAYKGQAGGPLRLRAFAYATSDTTGYILGAYGYGEGANVPDQGKYTVTLRRNRGGPWQLFSDMDNGNQPPRQSSPARQTTPAPQRRPRLSDVKSRAV